MGGEIIVDSILEFDNSVFQLVDQIMKWTISNFVTSRFLNELFV